MVFRSGITPDEWVSFSSRRLKTNDLDTDGERARSILLVMKDGFQHLMPSPVKAPYTVEASP